MVNYAELKNDDGKVTIRLRKDDGSLNIRKVNELINEHPDIFSLKDTHSLLSEIIDRSLNLEKKLNKLQRRVNFMEDEKTRKDKRALYGDVRSVKKDLDLFRMVNAKKPRKNARETIRREMELYDEEEDEVEDMTADISLQILKIG